MGEVFYLVTFKGWELYFSKAGVFLLLALLVGCGDERAQPSQAEADQSYSTQAFRKSAIVISDESALNIDGQIVRYDLLRNERGVFDRYTVESSKTLMGLEGAIFADLARMGYTRRVRKEVPGRYLVNYVRKGAITLGADYRGVKGSDELSRLVITLRVGK